MFYILSWCQHKLNLLQGTKIIDYLIIDIIITVYVFMMMMCRSLDKK